MSENKETTEKKKAPAGKKGSPELRKRREALKKKRAQQKQIKHAITIALACCLLIGCVLIISNVMSKNEDFEKTNSGEFIEESDLVDETELAYKAVPYFKEQYYDRYMDFAKKNSDKLIEDIVWMVNANLDMPAYEFDVPIPEYTETVIVNKYHKVEDGYMPEDLTLIDEQQLRQPAAAAFIKMRNAALSENLKISVASGYKSIEEQSVLYSDSLQNDALENAERYTARPGYSEHHTGLAVDLVGTQEEKDVFIATAEYSWIKEHCYEYGYIIRYPEGAEDITGFDAQPWHIRYVGEEISRDMKDKDIATYEEYYAKYLQ